MHLDNLDQKVISVNANDNCRIIIDGLAWGFSKRTSIENVVS